jgi:hypothetical protein
VDEYKNSEATMTVQQIVLKIVSAQGWRATGGLLVCVLLLAQIAFSQVGTQASITGTVTDPSGARVAGARVTATNIATGETKHGVAGQSGDFNILALSAGNYRVVVEAQGFKKWENPQVQLTVGDQIRVTPVLQVGVLGEVITVEGTSAALQTENATVETVVQMQQIRELPLATRNPLALVALAPGMRVTNIQNGGERAAFVQGNGLRGNNTNFQLDGLGTNAPMDEGGTGVPNVDAIAEFNVQSLNAGAEVGRDPMQVLIVTKGGTNTFHGSAFEFVQNDIFNAYDAFADKTLPKPRVRYNQFGGTVGGPIFRNKTFFFTSFQGTVDRNAVVDHEFAALGAQKLGDFSSVSTPIIDPTTGAPFPGNIIPADRIDPTSTYFLPWILTANSGHYFNANGNTTNKTWETTVRIDHQITSKQRIYGRYVYVNQPQTKLSYNPDPALAGIDTVRQHNVGINYTYTITNNILLTLSAGTLHTSERYSNAALGKRNDSVLAGIQGIPTAGREAWIGPPDINFWDGYTGVGFAGGWGVPGGLWGSVYNGKASLSYVHGAHTVSTGFEYGDWRSYAAHGSEAPRGQFNFSGQYTGDGFADFLLGYVAQGRRNDPLGNFGLSRAPYIGSYASDNWKLGRNLTLDLGVRYERWLAHQYVRNIASTWDPALNKVVLAEDSHGQPNLTAYPVTPGLLAVTQGLWTTASDAGYPRGLFQPNGHWSPRLGVTFRPFSRRELVLRAGYATFHNNFQGNIGGSVINPPHWAEEVKSISDLTLQRWETLFDAAPVITGGYALYAPYAHAEAPRTEEWNISVQAGLPLKTSLTVAYVGDRVPNQQSAEELNAAAVGPHTDIDADRPQPRFSDIVLYANRGRSWYNGLQTKLDRRFTNGLAFTFAYAFSRSMVDGVTNSIYDYTLPDSPAAYNRGRSADDLRHLETATVVWELPYGNGRQFGANIHGALNTILGGWQLSAVQTAHSGESLNVFTNDATLGNGYGTRADLVGDPRISNPTAHHWFNTNAFAPAPQYQYGNSGIGIVDGPGFFQVDTSLAKNVYLSEAKYFQFRWESFNLANRANLGNPDTTVGDQSFGVISATGGAARYMQFGLKFLF